MKKLFTLSALAALTAASLTAQAQITVDGTLSPAEIGTGTGKYQLMGTYTGAHSAADRGLKALYMGTTATTLNIMVVASPEKGDYNALLLYLDAPNKTGVAAGTRLAGGSDNSSQFRSQPTLDMPVDYGFRLTVSPLAGTDANAYHSKIDFTAAVNSAGKFPDVYLGSTNKTGTAFTVTDANSGIVGAKVSFKTSATGSVAANTTTGWEIEYPLSVLGGATANDLFRVMVAYVGDNAEFHSDVLPQITGQATALGADPNFTTIPGNQSYTYQVGVGVLASRSSAEALQAAAYPNPVAATSRLAYHVPAAAAVAVDVYNSLGQKVLNLLNDAQAAGAHTVALSPLRQLTAGSYLVTLRVGSQLSTHRVVVE
ncbi:T9SS type A sorting domain-containing protein [Hymenobacter metallicola]|uniref:T9SS type A sorting domain-containing protein n=1 Tax=Hymenobacter metallicola TaxID=2563114 RepID=A0A4Z0Q4D4_9BACT|nr:T9SS type A sorting domain-containing protein [Hymenobacter metallicola]TGE23582.1 T9SS type A sorting domain-containing protein [Hymenobacter metallicola]